MKLNFKLDVFATQELNETGYAIIKIDAEDYCVTKDSDGNIKIFLEIEDWNTLQENCEENDYYIEDYEEEYMECLN